MADDLVRTVREMLHVTAPAMREILTAEELAATSTRVIRKADGHSMLRVKHWPTVAPDEEHDDETLLEVHTSEDWGGNWTQGRETATEMYERFRNELQDFVAESKFGWGQWRP